MIRSISSETAKTVLRSKTTMAHFAYVRSCAHQLIAHADKLTR